MLHKIQIFLLSDKKILGLIWPKNYLHGFGLSQKFSGSTLLELDISKVYFGTNRNFLLQHQNIEIGNVTKVEIHQIEFRG